eukprot:1194304-Prorocentrum_minimum.AAC.1
MKIQDPVRYGYGLSPPRVECLSFYTFYVATYCKWRVLYATTLNPRRAKSISIEILYSTEEVDFRTIDFRTVPP